MQLHERITGNKNVLAIINYYKETEMSGKTPKDIIIALNLLAEKAYTDREVEERTAAALTMLVQMSPETEDIIAMLLYESARKHSIGLEDYHKAFSINTNADKYYTWTKQAYREIRNVTNWTKDAKLNTPKTQWTDEMLIDYFIMLRVCDKMFFRLLSAMREHGIPDAAFLNDVYKLAKEAHIGVRRGTGEPYLNHPIQVARILVDVGVESTVVAAALLHDVVEDNTKYTLESLKKFGQKVVDLVDCVTSVDNDYAASKRIEEYSSDKSDMDADTFQKLRQKIEENPANIFALYIKAADRIHNLRTIDDVESEKRFAKIDRTETEYLPLLRQYRVNYFIPTLEDLIWRTSNRALYKSIEAKYKTLLEYNRKEIEDTYVLLFTSLAQDLSTKCAWNSVSGFKFEIKKSLYLPYGINQIIKENEGDPLQVENYINKVTLPLCDFDIILDPQGIDANLDIFAKFFISIFNTAFAKTGRVIIDIERDEQNRFILYVEDQHRNVIRYRFMMRSDYNEYMTGDSYELFLEGLPVVREAPDKETITVFLKNGAEKKLPKGSTIIDLAFAVHPEIGFTLKSASIAGLDEGEPVSIYTILRDKNQVILEADTSERDGITQRFIPHARIDWLAHVVTEEAKQELVKYLERKYEGDNPYYEKSSKVSDTTFDTVFSELFENPILAAIVEEDA